MTLSKSDGVVVDAAKLPRGTSLFVKDCPIVDAGQLPRGIVARAYIEAENDLCYVVLCAKGKDGIDKTCLAGRGDPSKPIVISKREGVRQLLACGIAA